MGLQRENRFVCDGSIERLPKEEREQRINQRLTNIVSYAYRNVLPVREKFDGAGVSPLEIRTVKDLERIPVTTKDELVRLQRANPPFGGFLTVPVNSLSRVYVSPGPIYDVVDEERVSAFAKVLKEAGFAQPGDVVMVSTSFHLVPAGLVFTDALGLLGATVVPTGVGQTELQVQIARELRVNGYCGFPSFLVSLIKKAEEMGFDFRRDFNLRWAIGAGERHIQLLRRQLEDDYGIQVSQFYGTADTGILGYECNAKNGMHFNDEDAVVEIVNPDTGKHVLPGEEGEVVATLLGEKYPLIRFGTGDLSSHTDEPCVCGRTSPRLGAITGMIGDHVRAKGLFIHARELDEAMSGFPQVSKYQLVLSLAQHKDVIGLNVEITQPVEEDALSAAIKNRCKEVFRVTVDKIDFVTKGTLSEGHGRFVDYRFK